MRFPWDERYSTPDYYYGTEPNDFLKSHFSLIKKAGQVLSLGEGEGRNAVFLATQGFSVTAIDGSSVAVEKMAKLAQSKGVSVSGIVGDLAAFDMGHDRWDAIISIWCHVPSELRKTLLERSLKALKVDGIFLLEAYTPKQLTYKTGGPSSADMLVTLAELQKELKELTPLYGVEKDRDVREGQGHLGNSAVVQFIGRKVR